MKKISEAAARRASAITPASGGVRPMATACLLRNKFFAAAQRRGVTNGKI
jgi:5,10-methylene-tetrahydrofolate dehydrogenase/methenyl tetrahydrofolate cyclohydrolase